MQGNMTIFSTIISAHQCFDLLDHHPVILDCRFKLLEPQAGRSAFLLGHLPTAQFADLEKDCSGQITPRSGRHPLPELSVFLQRVAAWGISTESQVVLYDDQGGSFAARLWWMLRKIGICGTAVLDGGLQAWQAAGFPLSTEWSPPDSALLLQNIPEWQFIHTDQLKIYINDPTYLIVDARSEERYLGRFEPIDRIAGRIPASINRYHGLNFTQDGKFKSPEMLRAEFQSLLGNHSASQTIFYCGSGVTSCTHLLAMEVAGYPGAHLYVGSWSEWIQEPNNPILS